MALYTAVTGNIALAADLNQIVNLLNGSDTTTPVTISQRIRAQLTGATAASGYVGGTTTGAPTTGTFATGDFVVTQDGVVWVCTAAGSPGTWIRAGVVIDGTAADIANLAAAAAAGAIGKAADAGHVHSWGGLAVLANAQSFTQLQTFTQGISVANGITGTLSTAAQPNVTSLGTLTGLTVSALATFNGGANLVGLPEANASADTTGNVWTGVLSRLTIGWNNQARQIFTANTRDDTKAVEGDILVNV